MAAFAPARALYASQWLRSIPDAASLPQVQAAMEDGHRVFAELSPHPLLVRALEQTR